MKKILGCLLGLSLVMSVWFIGCASSITTPDSYTVRLENSFYSHAEANAAAAAVKQILGSAAISQNMATAPDAEYNICAGTYPTEEAAEQAAQKLRNAGIKANGVKWPKFTRYYDVK
jgi:hypothetical protein